MLVLLLSCFPYLSVGSSLITLKYYKDSDCSANIYGVGLTSNTCIQSQSSSVMVNCSSLGLMVTEYLSTNCSGSFTESLVTPAAGTCGATADFQPNNYFQTPSHNFFVTCSDTEEWVNDADYLLSRTTTVLQASSAIDFTEEVCPQNNLSTPMEYCFLNDATDYCLPTDTNSDSGSSDSMCLPAPVMYAYSPGCIVPSSSSRFYRYYSNNHGLGVLTTYTDSSCVSNDASYQLPYSECLGCNRFKDLKNSNSGGTGSVSTTTILIIVFSIIGFYCLVGLAFFTMCSCCGERNKGVTLTSSAQPAAGYPLVAGSQPYTGGSQPQYTPHYEAQPAQPYGAQSYGSQSNGAQQYGGYPQPNSPGYGGPSAPPPPPAYGQPSPFEVVSVQVPMDAKPGQTILVPKSNGQQIQVQLPPDVIPGSVIQVQG